MSNTLGDYGTPPDPLNVRLPDPRDARIAELEAALRPFAEAYEQFAKNEHCTRVLSLGQLGRLAAGELSGAHFKTASAALSTKEDGT